MQIYRQRNHFQCSTNRRAYRLFGNHCWLSSIWMNFFSLVHLTFPNGANERRRTRKKENIWRKNIYHSKHDYIVILSTFEMKRRVTENKRKITRFTDYFIKEPNMTSFIHLFLLALCQYKSKFCNGLWLLIEIVENSCFDEKSGWKHHKPFAFNKRFI